MNKLIELWHHLRRPHYQNMQAAIYVSRLARMHGHRGRVENCGICGDWTYVEGHRHGL